MYYQRPRRKKTKNYIAPIAVIIILLIGLFYGWKSITNRWIEQNQNTFSEKVFLNIENGSAKAMTASEKEWQNAPDKIDLYLGEKIKTGSDGRVTLNYFNDDIIRLNTSTEVSFEKLKRRGDLYDIETRLSSGQIWASVKPAADNKSAFKVISDQFDIYTQGATFAVDHPSNIYVLSGGVEVKLKQGNKVVKQFNVGVGQQLSVEEGTIEAVQRGESAEVLFALSDQFKQTNWYLWNEKKESGEATTDLIAEINEEGESENPKKEGDKEEAKEVSEDKKEKEKAVIDEKDEEKDLNKNVFTITTPKNNTFTNKEKLSISGTQIDGETVDINGEKTTVKNNKWSATIDLKEGLNTITIKSGSETKTLKVTLDQEKPNPAIITSPEANTTEELIEWNDSELDIVGTVEKDVYAVIVNNYRLTQYKAGSGTFSYYARTKYNNLKVGKNIYTIVTEDQAGNQSEAVTLTVELKEEALIKDETENREEEAKKTSPTGGVKITAPNNGEDFQTKETEFEISGIVPNNTAKVTVNNYKLSQFKTGDTTFKYRAYASIKNLKIGEKNTYTVKAFDESDQVIGSDTIIIDVESGSSAAPVITIPTSEAEYSTSLDTVVIGGIIGKWTTRAYLNGEEIKDYIPGSEKFRKSVNLNTGKNTFIIRAEKNGETVGEDTIVIIYQP